MFTKKMELFLKVKSPLHVGTGDSLSVIDLPIQREKHTDFPKIDASSFKGAIRSSFEKKGIDKKDIDFIFGPENVDNDSARIGAISFTDSKILLFPVKSIKGIFSLITCPYVIKRFLDDIEQFNGRDIFLPINNVNIKDGEFASCEQNENIINDKIVLDEYTFSKIDNSEELNKVIEFIATKVNESSKKIVILSNNDFLYFVKMATEVITRIKINNETGIVEEHALFNEEFLPVESVLYSQLFVTNLSDFETTTFYEKSGKSEDSVFNFIKENLNGFIQIGGDSTIGKGIVKVIL
ncbi:MAG: type III-B CRISPR module RAMP protein Cmr4 [bacterium]|nr:type III-B CRISPR module RAMP protein Cmr4 [bacterium]